MRYDCVNTSCLNLVEVYMNIKRPSLFILLLSLVSYTGLHAQIAIGAKAGYNFNSFRGNKEYEVVPGFTVGGFAKYPVLDFLTARAELLYVQQGARLEQYYVSQPELLHRRSRVTFHSIQVPVMAEFGLPSLGEEAVQPKLMLGGFYSFNVMARENYESVTKISGFAPMEDRHASNVTSLFQQNQFGLVGAIAAEVKAFGFPVALEFRYQYNLNPISTASNRNHFSLVNTHKRWGKDLYLSTLTFNVSVRLMYL